MIIPSLIHDRVFTDKWKFTYGKKIKINHSLMPMPFADRLKAETYILYAGTN